MYHSTPTTSEMSSLSQGSFPTQPSPTLTTPDLSPASLTYSLPTSQLCLPPTLAVPPTTKRHAQLAVRALNKTARALATRDYAHDPKRSIEPPAITPVQMKKRMRNRSAYISRQASRHYEKLLEEHVQTGEQERELAVAEVRKIGGQVECLRMLVALLEGQANDNANFESCLLDDVITTSPAY